MDNVEWFLSVLFGVIWLIPLLVWVSYFLKISIEWVSDKDMRIKDLYMYLQPYLKSNLTLWGEDNFEDRFVIMLMFPFFISLCLLLVVALMIMMGVYVYSFYLLGFALCCIITLYIIRWFVRKFKGKL